jgi:hypothetical protein
MVSNEIEQYNSSSHPFVLAVNRGKPQYSSSTHAGFREKSLAWWKFRRSGTDVQYNFNLMWKYIVGDDGPDCLTTPQVELIKQIYAGLLNPHTKELIFPARR